MNEVINLIDSLNINESDYVIVACSGGPDSMFLLDFLYKKKINCVCAHVNHKMRVESDSEYTFVKDYCVKNNIIFEGIELDGYSVGNFENYAREFRYDFFDKLVKKYKANYVFTAHHGDDLIETILMRLVRGSSLKGYSGFSKITKKNDYYIVRPLIYLTKDYIEKYNKDNNIAYVLDESNMKDDYTRNRYRHYVLPFLKEEDLFVNEKFLRYSETLKEVTEYIERTVNDYLNKIYVNNTILIQEFLKLDYFIQRECLKEIMRIWYPNDLYLVNDNHITELIKIISSKKTNIEKNFPGSLTVKKEYDKLVFMESLDTNNEYKYELNNSIELDLGKIIKVNDTNDTSNYSIRLNSKNIKLPIIVRSRLNGDKINVKNMDGTKKVNDIFIDLKISKSLRDKWPIVTDSDNKILWIPGLKKSDFDIPINEEYDIILKYEKGEE